MHDEFYSLTGKLKNMSNSLYRFSSVGEGVATRRLPRKGVSNSQGLADFAARLVNSVLNLPDGQVKFFRKFKSPKS